MISTKAIDLITASLQEFNAYAAGETPSAADATFAFDKLNARLDEWSARKPFAYAMSFNVFTLPINTQPVTIGPQGADFTVPQRPERLEGANLILTGQSNQPIDVPMGIRDEQWWNYQQTKSLTSTFPTDVYYQPDFPNGNLFFWPIATQGYQVRLEWWTWVTQAATQQTVLVLPPAYYNALRLTLAEELCEPFGKTPGPMLMRNALMARKAVQANNDGSPRIQTREAGQGSKGPQKPDFNWLSGAPYGAGQ